MKDEKEKIKRVLTDCEIFSLICPACKTPLSLIISKFGLKRLGCLHCLIYPVVSHSDFNKVMSKFVELRKLSKM